MATKKCSRCKVAKALSAFGKNKRKPGGLHYYCRTCMTATKREYRARHPDIDATRSRKYREANQGRINELARQWRKKNKERYLATYWRWKKANPEKPKALGAAWRRKYPERARASSNANMARRKAVIRLGVSNKALAAWIRIQPKICFWCACECSQDFQVDHLIPISHGGAHELENLAIACESCNQRKNALMPHEFARSLGAQLSEVARHRFDVAMIRAAA